MRFGAMGARGGFGGMGTALGTASPSASMPPAPPGYHWDWVTFNGQQTTFNGANVVFLVAN